MKKGSAEYEEIVRQLPAIPGLAAAREGALLEIARRVASGDGALGSGRPMQVYFALWLDKLLEAGVDVSAKDRQGLDCFHILHGAGDKPSKTALFMVRRLLDHGFPFVQRQVIRRSAGRLLHASLAHMAMQSKRGIMHCDPHGNNTLHACAEHSIDVFDWYLDEINSGQGKRMMFDPSQNVARNDGSTPLHLLWENARLEDFADDDQIVWRSTHLLVNVLGGDMRATDENGRSVLDVVRWWVDGGVDIVPTPGLNPLADAIHAKTMAMIMSTRVDEAQAATKHNPRL